MTGTGAIATEALTVEQFCEREFPRLVGSLSLIVGDPQLAQDLAQETLLRVWQRWDRVRSLDRPGAWAHRVAVNLATSAHRTSARQRRLRSLLDLPAPVVVETSTAVAVRDAIARLEPRQRAAVVLRYFADLSVREVADILSCPEGTVKTLTYRAIAELRRQGMEFEA